MCRRHSSRYFLSKVSACNGPVHLSGAPSPVDCNPGPPKAVYFTEITLGNATGAAGSNKPKENTAVAEAIATYCFPPAS